MNDKKVSFIICCNDEFYMQECRVYLNELIVPKGYEVDILEVAEAKSMTSGCNEGMQQSDAKYKIYMHQDVFITNKNFLSDILQIFQSDINIGMIGLVGTPYLCWEGTMWKGVRFGGFYKLDELIEKDLVHRFYPLRMGYMEMDAVDGLLIATQYDIPWREDVFQKWDFYDVSQSFEFQRAGYKIVVPGQEPEWYIHDCGAINLEHYDEAKEKFLLTYPEYMEGRRNQTWEDYLEQVRLRIEQGYHGNAEEKEYLLGMIADLHK
ncbi:MAG: glycosyltransferase family protein [Roseburia sp.]|nr:glycosyltransferase family protein [Roseburia sp.]MCM1278434.1 glycosyltransferase family protein [Robinsoniella sp.]